MSEMLGNYYFMIQKYQDALAEYEKSMQGNNVNPFLKKKIILCLIKLGKYQTAIETYKSIITKNDLEKYISTLESEQLICRHFIEELEKEIITSACEEMNIILGILWSFCDLTKSKEFFSKASENFYKKQFEEQPIKQQHN